MAAESEGRAVTHEESHLKVHGCNRKYSIFVPTQASAGEPVPALIFFHGVTRSRVKHRGLAMRLSRSLNLVVLTPESPTVVVPSLLCQRERARARCIADAVFFTKWLRNQPFVDPAAVLVGGFDAGGAVALGATVDLQDAGTPPLGLLLLDPVPWPRTVSEASHLEPLNGGCLLVESEASAYNKQLAFRNEVFTALPSEWCWPGGSGDIATGKVSAVRVLGASHVDVEEILKKSHHATTCEVEDGGLDHRDGILSRLAWGEPHAAKTKSFHDLAEEFAVAALATSLQRSALATSLQNSGVLTA